MTRRAKRPLDKDAVIKANKAFYAQYPEMVVDGKPQQIPAVSNDPCHEVMREAWRDSYAANGGQLVTLPPPVPARPGAVVIPCKAAAKTVLSKHEADATFKELAANKNIPFDYPVDCCYSRAHSMCAMMKAKGIESEKYWLYNEHFDDTALSTADLKPVKPGGAPVSFPNGYGADTQVAWVYHVAPLVQVETSPGVIEKMVFDPSLADKPLTQAQWRAIQGNPAGAYGHVSDKNAYFTEPRTGTLETDADNTEACKRMRKHALQRDANRRAEALAKKAPTVPPRPKKPP